MANTWKAAGVGAVAGLAVPVAGISGLATVGLSLMLVLAMLGIGPAHRPQTSVWALLTGELMIYLLVSLAIFVLSHRFLARLQARAQGLVSKINAQEGLTLDAKHLLGYPPAFVVFDQRHRKLAVCLTVGEAWKIHDFSWLLSWQMTWREVEQMEVSGGSRQVNASGISVPTFGSSVRLTNFAIELQTADPQQPLLSFPMSRRAAEIWCARLNAIING